MEKRLPLTLWGWLIAILLPAQCVTNVDFTTWKQGGQLANGNWQVQNGGSQVFQSVNGDPTFFYSPFDLMNVHVSGNFKSTDGDNDYMGFVFSFLNPLTPTDSFDCWLFDWKQSAQSSPASQGGMSLNRCYGVLPPSTYSPQFWGHTNNAAFTCVANHFGGPGWVQNFNHAFDLYLTYTEAKIYVDGTLQFDWQDCYKVGRFGFYNLSQQDCYYSNFQYSLYIDFTYPAQVCNGSTANFTFIPTCASSSLNQYQNVTWDYGDGTTDVINNPTTTNVNVTHTYNTAGTYTVKLSVTDVNGCTATQSHTVTVAGPITLTPALTPPSCNGGSNGSVGATAAGGFGNYTYIWNGTEAGSTWAGVAAGTYTVSVTDGVCAATAQYTLNQPTALSATTSHTDATCGANNGSVTISIAGGTPPYTGVNWSGTPGYTVTNLGPGTYVADFHDANGCSALLEYKETVGTTPCGITSSVTSTDVSCFGGSNGLATLNVTGTVGTAVITWSNGQSGSTATGLSAGNYTYNYSDGDPAHAFSGSITIYQPGAAMVPQLTVLGIVCPGANDGQATASVISGGVPPYHYAWSVNNNDVPVDTGLSPGPITVTITDANLCTATATGNISGIPSLNATFVTTMDSCFHSGGGSAIATVSGGTPPYSYAWSNFRTDTSNTHLIAGTYSLTITDHNNCSVTSSVVVNGPASAVQTSFTAQNVLCYGANTGSFNTIVSGGVPGYTYAWSPSSVSGANPTGLSPGDYIYTVTDAYGCTAVGGDTIVQPAAPLTAATSHIDVSCNGGSDGALIITVSGGTSPYNYQGFTIPAGTDTLPGLAANTYSGTISDSNACTVNISETINQPGPQSLTLTSTPAACYGDPTGTALANFVNATGAVSYDWSPGGILPASRTGLTGGTYMVTATDSKNCTVTNSTSINQPPAIVIQAQVTNVDCFGNSTGSITLNVSGGTGATYTYAWTPNVSNSNSASGIAAGGYSITVTDQANCTVDTVLTVTQPALLSDTKVVNDISCSGQTDGNITITPTGGIPGYTYTWNPNVSTGNSASGLVAGSYAVTITDANNCTATDAATIIEPAVLSLTQSQTSLVCFGVNTGMAEVTPTGGTTPYNYSWNPNTGTTTDSAINIGSGTYNVTVTDNHSCTITATFTLSAPPQLIVGKASINETCFGDNKGQIILTTSGGTGGYTYTWSPNITSTDSALNLAAGNYAYSVNDANNCSVTQTVVISQPAQISLTPSATNITCYNAIDGAITVTTSGGTSPFSYTLENGNATVQTSANGQFNNLPAASYEVVATDANTCSDSIPVAISSPSQVLANVDSTNVTCYGLQNGQISVATSGGTPGYTFSLSNGSQNSTGTFINLSAGSYTVTITDAANCSITESIIIAQPDSFVINVTPAQATVNLGDTLQLLATSNQPDSVSYLWDPLEGLSCANCPAPVFNNVYTTTYHITGTSSTGCSAFYSVTITVVPNYNIFIPNVFSPDGNGNNDSWHMFGDLYSVKQFGVTVFNRWGEKVFESNDINAGWDGTYKGEKAPVGVYVYDAHFVWLDNHSDSHYTGSVTLLR